MSSGTPAQARKGPLFWVLTGGLLFLLLLAVALVSIAYLSGTSQEGAGGELGVLRTMIRLDKNNQILEENAESRSIRFRNQKSGKEFVGTIDPSTKQFHYVEIGGTEPEKAPAQ